MANAGDSLNGWNYSADLLMKNGVPKEEVYATLSNERMPHNEPMIFKVQPKESKRLYKALNTKETRQNAISFYKEHKSTFAAASKKYNVSESVILSILQIETMCGKNTGNAMVFPALLRLASATDPENIASSYRAIVANNNVTNVTERDVADRAIVLQIMFLPHAIATFTLAKQLNLSPLDLRGSSAGALGIPQFLPGSWLEYGVDGDNNGTVDLFNPKDAIFSVANYLHAHGWKKKVLPLAEQKRVIWHYNHSTPYIDTVLAMAAKLAPMLNKKT